MKLLKNNMKLLSNLNNDQDIILKSLEELKKTFIHCLIFSSIINILSLALPIYSMQVLDRVLGSSSIETLIFLSIIIFVCVIVMNAITNIRDYAFYYAEKSFEKKLSKITFEQNIHDSFKVNIGSQYIKDLSVIKSFISSPYLALIFDLPWVIVFLATIFYINWIPGILVSVASIVFCIFAFFNHKILKKDNEQINDLQIKIGQKLELLLRNSEVAIAMGMIENLSNRYNEDSNQLKELEKKLKTKSKTIAIILKNVRYTVQILITFISAILIIKGKMSSGGMIAISTLASKVLAPFDASAGIFQSLINVKKSYQRLKVALKKSNNFEERIELPDPKGDVQFDSVIHLPQNNNAPIIRNISFIVLSGEIIGIIGKSGSGKTTISRLITGVIEPTRGRVMIDSAPIDFWNKSSLGKFIGYLPQDVELFHASIKDNIAKMNKDVRDEDIIEAAKFAGVHELILSLPQGYETHVGNVNISAGQRQRIALARCFYGSPKIVVLDEPNSNLDAEGENSLLETLLKAKNAKITVFVVSHKPSILKVTDRIMVIDGGEIKVFDDKKKVIENFSAKS